MPYICIVGISASYVMYHCDDSYNITLRDRQGNVIKRDDLDRWTALYTSFTVI